MHVRDVEEYSTHAYLTKRYVYDALVSAIRAHLFGGMQASPETAPMVLRRVQSTA